jgi:hypothetical protein
MGNLSIQKERNVAQRIKTRAGQVVGTGLKYFFRRAQKENGYPHPSNSMYDDDNGAKCPQRTTTRMHDDSEKDPESDPTLHLHPCAHRPKQKTHKGEERRMVTASDSRQSHQNTHNAPADPPAHPP